MTGRPVSYRRGARKHCSTRSISTWLRMPVNGHHAERIHFLMELTIHTNNKSLTPSRCTARNCTQLQDNVGTKGFMYSVLEVTITIYVYCKGTHL